MPTTITTDHLVVTLINTFTVDPDRQEELARLLAEATDEVIKHAPGFVSAKIHRSLDGRHVATYAQWRAREDIEAMLRDPKARSHLVRASAIAEYQPIFYQVASVHAAP